MRTLSVVAASRVDRRRKESLEPFRANWLALDALLRTPGAGWRALGLALAMSS